MDKLYSLQKKKKKKAKMLSKEKKVLPSTLVTSNFIS